MVLDKKHPVDIDHLLVVTFTNAAAAQMKERVAKALEKALQENPSDVRLQQQAALVQNAADYYHRQFLPLCASESFS